jgi:hypothetical protein
VLVDGQIVELRVPYPMGFFTKGLEGINDTNAGWKGRALWASSDNRTPQHIEAIDAPAPRARRRQRCRARWSSSSSSARIRSRISAIFDRLASE